MTPEDAWEILKSTRINEDVIEHTKAVIKKALEIAERYPEADKNLLEIGAILHDIGRSVSHGVDHGVKGAEILRKLKVDEKICLMVERHVGSGIDRKEAENLDLPPKDYLPQTIEEKILCYADTLIMENKDVPFGEALARYENCFGKDSKQARRLEKLHKELNI